MPSFLKDFVNLLLPKGSPARTKATRVVLAAAAVATATAAILNAVAEAFK